MTFGSVLRYLRQSKGLSQAELARRVAVSPSYLSLLESDDREGSLSLLRRIATELGIPGTVLLAAALAGEYEGVAEREMQGVVERMVEATAAVLQQPKLV